MFHILAVDWIDRSWTFAYIFHLIYISQVWILVQCHNNNNTALAMSRHVMSVRLIESQLVLDAREHRFRDAAMAPSFLPSFLVCSFLFPFPFPSYTAWASYSYASTEG